MSLYQDISRLWLEKTQPKRPRPDAGHMIVSAANLPAVKRLVAYASRPPAANDSLPAPANSA